MFFSHKLLLKSVYIPSFMNLEKLFWSKTKVDILKYLIFCRQWVSMRALESEIWWTFPAIKKQVDSLEESGVVEVQKESSGFSISIKKEYFDLFKQIFFTSLKAGLTKLFDEYSVMIDKYFLWKFFWTPLDMDIIIIYKNMEKPQIDTLKTSIAELFREFYVENVSVVFMSTDEWEKRYRLADKFVLQVIRFFPDIK